MVEYRNDRIRDERINFGYLTLAIILIDLIKFWFRYMWSLILVFNIRILTYFI
jgi:hypothetical protein